MTHYHLTIDHLGAVLDEWPESQHELLASVAAHMLLPFSQMTIDAYDIPETASQPQQETPHAA